MKIINNRLNIKQQESICPSAYHRISFVSVFAMGGKAEDQSIN